MRGNRTSGLAAIYHPYRAAPFAAPARAAACPEARRALRWAVAALFCFGFVLGPIALQAAQRARLSMAEDEGLSGIEMANAARVIGKIAIGLHLVLALVALCGAWFVIPRPGYACR